MKSFIKSSLIKGTVVEIVSPRLLESPQFQKNDIPQTDIPSFAESIPEEADRVKEIIARAEKEAENILAEAQKQAEEIIRRTTLENELIQDNLRETIRREKFSEAFEEGYAQGLAQAQAEAQTIIERAHTYLELAQTALADQYHKVDQELVMLSVKIAERLLHSALEVKPERILAIIRNLVLMPQDKTTIKIHLSAEDWEWYREIPDKDKPAYPVIVDESLRPGNTFLECAEGVFEADLESQLQKIEEMLREEFERGKLDVFSEEDRAV